MELAARPQHRLACDPWKISTRDTSACRRTAQTAREAASSAVIGRAANLWSAENPPCMIMDWRRRRATTLRLERAAERTRARNCGRRREESGRAHASDGEIERPKWQRNAWKRWGTHCARSRNCPPLLPKLGASTGSTQKANSGAVYISALIPLTKPR